MSAESSQQPDPEINFKANDGLFIQLEIENLSLNCLLDTGSTVTIIHTLKFQALSERLQQKLEPTKFVLRMADGAPVPCVGQACLPLKVGNEVFLQYVLIADIEAPFVLGYDFLYQNNCLVEERQGLLVFEDQTVQCVPESNMPSVFQIALQETIEIPAQSEMIAFGKFTGDRPHFSTAMIEPYDQSLSDNGILLAKTVIDTNCAAIPLRFVNFNSFPTKIYKNKIAAVCDMVTVESNGQTNTNDNSRNLFSMSVHEQEEMPLPEHLQVIYNSSAENLSPEQAESVKGLLLKYAHIFSKTKSDLGNCDIIPHRINTGLSPPIRLPPRRVPLAIKEAVETEVQRLIDTNLVTKSKSAWAFPPVPIKKKDGSIRICVDYRKLNEVTLPDSYPLPRVQDCLDALEGASWFSVLDCTSGFFQIETHPNDRDKTAFICHKGLFEFKVLPMGLINSPATYQRILETIMAGKQYETCLIYLDDLIVYSKTFDEHLQRLDEVFERISFANLKFSPKKCFLFSRETKFLGHRVSANGVSTCDDKVVAVKEWPIPTCVKDLRAFLGLASYYRRFIKSFSTIAAPLNKLTEKGVNFRWSSECQTAFDSLKSALVSAPILGYPNSHDTLYLDCDASSVGIGAVLSQVQNGQERVIAYFSKSLNKTQRQYCVTRRELLAIFEAVKHFHCYLYGVQFIVRTDHGALSWLMKFKNPSGQLARWLEVLSTYRFTIEHRAGVKHGNCDSLSRVNRPCSACIHCERREQEEREAQSNDVDNCRCNQSKSEKRETGSNSVIFNGQREKTPTNLTKNESENILSFEAEMPICNDSRTDNCDDKGWDSMAKSPNPYGSEKSENENGQVNHIQGQKCYNINSSEVDVNMEKWKEAQILDSSISVLYKGKQQNMRPSWEDISHTNKETKTYWAQWSRLELHNGVLCRKYFDTKTDTTFLQIVLPKSLRDEILTELHDHVTSGHLGTMKTLEKVKRRFYWHDYKAFVESWCRKCLQCQSRSLPKLRPRAPMKQSRTGTPLQRVSLDLLGPFPETEKNHYKYVLSICDHFTRWIELYPMRDMEASTVARIFVEEFVSRHGLVRQILTDQGRQFESKLFQEICQLLDIDKKRSTSFHPQTNGIQERFNRTIEDMLSKYVSANQRDWDKYLPILLLAYRSSIHESTHQTPYMMMFGRHALLPVDLVCPQPSTEREMTSHEYVDALKERLEKVYKLTQSEMAQACDRQKKTYDHRIYVIPYSIGDLVWLRNPMKTRGKCPKLQPRWEGPYKIRRQISDLVFEIEKVKGSRVQRKIVHRNRLKPCIQ